jgi:hypothetical protein
MKGFNIFKTKLFERNTENGRIISLEKPGIFTLLPFFIIGSVSLIWFIIRVIPKPNRATYPCMRVAMPIAYSFMTYMVTMISSVLLFKNALKHFKANRFKYATAFVFAGILLSAVTLIFQAMPSKAVENNNKTIFSDPLGPNNPIGTPKGIMPGRVVWVYNPNATNENCTNNSHSDAYWLDNNCNQDTVDAMFSEGIRALTGKDKDEEAWDNIFRYFNICHGKGDTGYVEGETIFVKINAVTAYYGAEPTGEMPASAAIEYDTSPQTILALLRQLINKAGVPQNMIFIGDPMCDIWNHLYNKFYAEFPDVNYVSKRNIPGRYKLTASAQAGIFYSDKGTVMNQITSHNFFNEMMNADYLINIPTMKGHRWAGVTFFAKNHFGSNTTDGSWQLHKGLMKPDNDPLRSGYHLYRVFVDLMSCKYLGGNTLLYYMDALWSTSYEHQKPQKFQTAPFNNDWSSSVLLSLDPVAIESVCLDILQKEFKTTDMAANPPRYTYVQYDGVDDYLHQAASSEWWPTGITYDPDNTGSPIESLGVHEHWNNENDMQYSRNLGTGEGIDLVKLFHIYNQESLIQENKIHAAIEVYPNPVLSDATIICNLDKACNLKIDLYSIDGKWVETIASGYYNAGMQTIKWAPHISKGLYIICVKLYSGYYQTDYSTQLQII